MSVSARPGRPSEQAYELQADEGSVNPSGRPSLEWLINPISKEEFFRNYWEKKPLVVRRNQPNYFSSLLTLDEIDRVITTLDRRYPDITLKNAAGTVAADDYTVADNVLDVAKVYQLFGEGCTITLHYLDTIIPQLTHFCRHLENEFSCPLQTNVYLTPSGAQGAKPHYDTHDVFVLQIVNSKHWTIYGTPVELPLPGQDFDASAHERGNPTLEFELDAGDIAYIPRGVVHDARSGKNVSLHVTAGMLRYTWTDLLLELVAEVSLSEPSFRKALPPGFAREGFDKAQARETLRNLLERLSAKAELDPLLDRFVDEFISTCPPILRGQMEQIASLDSVTLNSVAGTRAGTVSPIRTNGHLISVSCYGREVSFPAYASEAVRFALSNPKFIVRDLPGDLEDAGKLTLVRRLIREGLVMVQAT